MNKNVGLSLFMYVGLLTNIMLPFVDLATAVRFVKYYRAYYDQNAKSWRGHNNRRTV